MALEVNVCDYAAIIPEGYDLNIMHHKQNLLFATYIVWNYLTVANPYICERIQNIQVNRHNVAAQAAHYFSKVILSNVFTTYRTELQQIID